jgi:hypothetical protein
MTTWKQRAAKLVAAAAFVAGAVLCADGAYDHTRPPPAPVTTAAGGDGATLAAPEITCARDASGITCTEEMVVVAPRRASGPVLVSQNEPARRPERAERREGVSVTSPASP